ncbi:MULTISPECIES: hypothetical protein [unclassified Streptomyces]|uniref:hypothetical protein n=1 Tax=unclassified Streptomyces TaxID=2593676 RepID=UPI002E10ED08|nr:hypothetical protein OG457_45085 [Streptomyces sp. NBC_01207]WTA23988.1 hypothetical protein OG365_38760 [Streptomyces sp. NBC_00853]
MAARWLAGLDAVALLAYPSQKRGQNRFWRAYAPVEKSVCRRLQHLEKPRSLAFLATIPSWIDNKISSYRPC